MKKLSVIVLIGCVLAVSCVSSPAPAAKAPEWTLSTPAPDATNTYFVASSSDDSGDRAAATEDAAALLIAQIFRYMGVKIEATTTGEAKGTLDSYSAEVTSVVKQSSSGRLSGFTIKDRYVVAEGSRVTVYILAQYATADLNKEKARIAAVIKEKEDAVAKPESAGDSAAADGRWFDSVRSYLEAAAAAGGADIDNADVKLERNINKARAVLGKLRFVRIDAPAAAGLGKDFPKPFRARLVYGEGDSAPGIPGAEVFVTYQRRQASGRTTNKTERVMTDASGVVSFAPPAPDFVGKTTVTFTLNLDSTRDLLDKIPARYEALVEAVREDLSRRSIGFEFTVASEARTVSTGVAILDLADDGKPASTTVAQGGLFEALAKEKFKAGLAPIASAMLASMDDSAIFKAAKAQYGASLARFIYGTARIESAVKDGSMWQATARMTVRCVDLATGVVLYSVEKTAVAVASDEAAARRGALVQVSKDAIAKDLMASLP